MSPYDTLKQQSSKTTVSWRYCLKRLFWASMLIMHATPIHALALQVIHSSNSSAVAASLWSLLGLGLSAIFFVLKVADVSWLRRNPGWRSTVASALIIALIHVGVLAHSSTMNNYSPVAPIGVIVLATFLTETPRAFRRSARSLWLRLSGNHGQCFSLAMFRTWQGWINYHFQQCQSWFRTCLSARAPPCAMPI